MVIAVDPKIDYVFKRLFGSVELSALLVNLINAVLGLIGDRAVQQVEILNPFVPGEQLDEKLAVLDIRARDGRGQVFLVEMQVHPFRAFAQRILYYWAGAYREQLSVGANYQQLQAVYSICVLNFVLFPETVAWHQRFELVDRQTGVRFSEQLEVHTLELPKFRRAVEELGSDLERWAWFLLHAEGLEGSALPAALRQPVIQQATEVLEAMSMDVQERLRAEARRKALLDYNQLLLEARESGEKAGFDKGYLLGRIDLLCRLKKAPAPDRAILEAMNLTELTALAGQLEQEALGP